MPGSAIVSGNGVVLIEIPAGGNTGEVLTKLSNDDFDFDWAPGGGGGGQVDSVVGGVNINVNSADPVNPIVNLDAAIVGVSVNGVTLTTAGAATNFLNEQGNYVAVVTSPTLQDAYNNAPAVPQITINGTPDPFTLDASVAGDIFAVRSSGGVDSFRVSDTGVILGRDTSARTNQTLDIGEQAATGLFDRIQGRAGLFLGSSNSAGARVAAPVATLTLDSAMAGIIGGNSNNAAGAGVPILRHGNTAIGFKPVATIVNLWAAAGDAVADNNGGGAFLGGSTYTAGSGEATLQALGFGSFSWAYAYPGGANQHLWQNSGGGAFMSGYSYGGGTVNVIVSAAGAFGQGRPSAGAGTAEIRVAGEGAFVQGRVNNGNAGTLSRLFASGAGDGAFVQGLAFSSGANLGAIEGLAAGAFAQGRALGGVISVNAGAEGGFAHGNAQAATRIEAGADGAFAVGNAGGGNNISATGVGSFAVGDSTSGLISATAANAAQFGPGTNATADSLQVGGGGALLGATASATVPNVVPDLDDPNTGLGAQAADNLSLIAGGLEGVRVEDPADLVAGETSLWLFDDDNNVLEQVTVGAADSGGVGFKVLRIPN